MGTILPVFGPEPLDNEDIMPSPVKLCREPWSKAIQHLPAIKALTKAAMRRLRHATKAAIRKGEEPPTRESGGERY